MRRREVLALIGGVAVAWPLASRAQQPERMRRIAMLTAYSEADASVQSGLGILAQRLEELGWRSHSNMRVEVRWGDADGRKMQQYARELISFGPDVMIVESTAALRAASRETQTIPIVFVQVTDPVSAGFVSSLALPGGNITGFTNFEASIGEKWLEILKELCPRLARVAAIFNPATHSGQYWPALEAAARALGLAFSKAPVQAADELALVMRASALEPNCAVVVLPDPFTIIHRHLLVELAERHGVPAAYAYRFFPEGGGLVSYGVALVDLNRGAAAYVDRILRGEKPSALPVQRPTKYEMVINLRTAKALGLVVPHSFLARADEVIE
jgi:putative tryptophan/tyrosine transport system substrate-binding protein